MRPEQLAKKIRIHSVKMANSGGGSHIGSALSIADILGVLYSGVLKLNPKDPSDPKRDRFILSKGHAGAAVYAALAEVGFFSKSLLSTHYQDGSNLSGHVSHKGVPGVEFSTGSLGHGLGIGAGIAKAAKINKNKYKTYVLLSDGECDEGSVWEAAMFSAHHRLNNLIAIVDYNKLQSLDTVEKTLGLEPFKFKWESFGWHVIEVDGHNYDQLHEALFAGSKTSGKPTVLICHTIKGKGVSFMENSVLWHYRCPKGKEFELALEELKK
tara:strand:+ start:523 stop:1326 length:804 start_codon:yes stop_codon:yes gene_type:complete